MDAATRWPIGWSWKSGVVTNRRDLTGLAHGAAGFGLAFIELYAASGDTQYRYAADQAFAYEDAFFNTAFGNWPDFRNATLGEMTSSDVRRNDLARRLRNGESPTTGQPPYVTSWCHGAPGIGLARLRAFEILKKEQHRRSSEIAVATTAAASQGMHNYSLCHGIFGNDATLIEASRVLTDSRWAAQALERAEAATERYELAGRPWPSGALSGVPDPSLMLGDAGIGYHLLRLVEPRVPSILLPIAKPRPLSSTERQAARPAADDDARHRTEHIRVFFSRSMQVARRLSDQEEVPALPEGDDPVLAFAKAIREMGMLRDAGHSHLIADASAADLARLDMIMAITDSTDTLLYELSRVPSEEVDWTTARLSLSPFVRLVTEERDWDAWLESDRVLPPQRADTPIHILLHRRAGAVTDRRLNRLTSVVLLAVIGDVTMEQLYRAVREDVAPSVPDTALRRLVRQVIINAYEAGVIVAAPATISA